MSPDNLFVDSNNTGRYVRYVLTDDGGPNPSTLAFAIGTGTASPSSASAPDNDASFKAIVVDGVRFDRSARTSYVTPSNFAVWSWPWGALGHLPSSGNVTVDIEFE